MADHTKQQTAAIQKLQAADLAVEAQKEKVGKVQQAKLVPAINACHDAGISLREIGEYLGVSHVTVMRMMKDG